MKMLKSGVRILVALIILFILASLLAPLHMFTMEDKLLSGQLNNKYIDREFDGWKTVSIPGFRSFKIPGNWELHTENEVYTITDEHDNIIAYGALIGENSQGFATYRDFLQAIISFDIIKYTFEYDHDFVIINLSEFGILSIQGEAAESNHTFIKIYDDSSKRILLVFPEGTETEYTALFETAQAVVYSAYYH